jgi:poly(hydroxyalkanoate) depolymerase family esterase
LLVGGAAALTAAGCVTAAMFTAPAAKAASLVQVTGFGNNPSNNKMYIYVPNNVRANPPILVALHQCTGTGPGFFGSTAFASLADQFGFIVIYPDANRSGQCWDVSSSQALSRNGGSDPVGIMSMITYAEQHFSGNASQVYVTGASSGAMMTNVLLADYPDVFKAGAAFMGVPDHCFFTGTVDGWNSQCANGQVSMTAQQWGDLARGADPGYSGPRPRMQLWHGTADTTLNFNNFGQEILQWTNVTGVSSTPVSTTTPVSGWTETMYGSTANPTVEGFAISGAGHVLPESGQGMESRAISFFGLNSTSSGGNTVTVANPGTQTGTVGMAASVQVSATDSGGAALTFSATGLPAGLSISSSGLISGTPTTAATSSVTVTARDSTGASGSTTFSWVISTSGGGGGGGTCHVTYTKNSEWAGGFTAQVVIANTGTTAVNGWSLTFTFPGDQKITSNFNGGFSQTGENATLTNASYNGAIAAGSSVSVGFQGSWTSNDSSPTAFALNGAACS